jgi:hypothetical protein
MTDFAFLANRPAEPVRSARHQRVSSAWGEVCPSTSTKAGRSLGGSGRIANPTLDVHTAIRFGGRAFEKCSVGDPGGGAV